ncbi:unnamed protein product [Chrysodeixis includens]|uniref:RZ-type domain-containing protein n=1 Tax=Chrysodeixis includens TaxID=689277 RepID=A0A9P0BPM1_CHRIL|nr:unnamed protein product [Chrysodeixis includens]
MEDDNFEPGPSNWRHRQGQSRFGNVNRQRCDIRVPNFINNRPIERTQVHQHAQQNHRPRNIGIARAMDSDTQNQPRLNFRAPRPFQPSMRGPNDRPDNDTPQRSYNQRAKYISFKTLEDIARGDPKDVLQKINERREAFMNIVGSPVQKHDIFVLVVAILSKISLSPFVELKSKLILDVCNSDFISNLRNYLTDLPYVNNKKLNNLYWNDQNEFWKNLIQFFGDLVEIAPSVASKKCRALIDSVSKTCLEYLNQNHAFVLSEEHILKLDEIRKEMTDFSNKYQAQVEGFKNRGEHIGQDVQPPENFRILSVVPTRDDIMDSSPFVRPNIVQGAYNDVEHYLDVQFRLLREDCFGPIREGIKQFLREPSKRKYDNVRIFHNVKFVCPYVANLKMGVVVQIDMKMNRNFKRINWAHNKRFLFGSIVLFTKDDCKSFIAATIVDRDVNLLSSGKLPVSLIDTRMDNSVYNLETFTMIESEVYFEPYFRVLKAMQETSFPRHLAMHQYIVTLDPEIKHPQYLTPDQEFCITDVIQNDNVLDYGDNPVAFKVLQPETWPTKEDLNFNESQYEAYRLALTHEFAVIQGPPGTGKTFIGIHVAKALLQNVESDSGLLLIICYTNHALDQFLEAISKITNSIVRIGSQSRNKAMEEFNIMNLRRKYMSNTKFFNEQRFELVKAMDALQEALMQLDIINNGVVSYSSLRIQVPELGLLKEYYTKQEFFLEDPLYYWLFENCYALYKTKFEECLLEYQAMANDEDENDRKRKEVILDEDHKKGNLDKARSTFASFSVSDTRIEIGKLIHEYNRKQEDHEKRRLQFAIQNLHSQILLYSDMANYRHHNARFRVDSKTNFSAFPMEHRWAIYYMWVTPKLGQVQELVQNLEAQVPPMLEAYEETRLMMDAEIMKRIGVKVVGMTTSGAARMRKLLAAVAPKIVIVEEAAEVLEQHIITALTRDCQHLILIGDHQQLRPSASHIKLARHYGIEVSLFERMITNGIHSRRLNVQHRMRPEIAALISPHIYSDLANHPSVERFDNVLGMDKNLYFFSHNFKEEESSDSNSRSNNTEADMTLALANYLMQQGYKPEDVTILAAYSGQMFYLKKERSKYVSLSNVKITVLDNYQGEESKIIILSLVRNNSENKIGFLGTENRICVALSRAKEGFYIFGNMEMLKGKSELWKKIAVTLENNGSLGDKLVLRCQNHPDQVRTLTTPEDFNNLPPEGGCYEKCTHQYYCGHLCQKYCHGYDRQHLTLECSQKCERIICDLGHVCPMKCREKCEPCKVKVLKTLPCNHDMDVDCHREPDDPANKCLTLVDVTLPNCGHETQKCCFVTIDEVPCKEPCVYRLEECGHVCRRKCHVTDDPDHEEYNCTQPCARAKNGCTAGLIGDRGDHQCPKQCYMKCDDCHVQVKKKRSNCKHIESTACNQNIDEVPCRKKCARIMSCGHHCKLICYEECGNCKQMVTKEIPECNHKVKMECMKTATRECCTKKCSRILPCGHPCKQMCREDCDQSRCTELASLEVKSPCGHNVTLPCNILSLFKKGELEVERLMEYCGAPCGQLLACEHPCGGSCAACRQGRLHEPCKQTCHRENFCGHECEEPCNQICPPCKMKCEVKCPHSHCKKLCCEPCVPCQEKCSRECVHGACSRRCGEPCSRAACDEACARRLACGHACRGLCGEPCVPVCRLCSPDTYPENFYGDPYDDDERLILLQDCGHVFSVEEMDGWIHHGQDTVKIKTCPKCRKPIINTYRYKDLVNAKFENEINPIKIKVFGTNEAIKSKKNELKNQMDAFFQKYKNVLEVNRALKNTFLKYKHAVTSQKKEFLLHIEMQITYLNVFEMIVECWGKYETKAETHNLAFHTELERYTRTLLDKLKVNTESKFAMKLSEQQQNDIGNEIKRLNAITQFAEMFVIAKQRLENPKVKKQTEKTKEAVFSLTIFNEDKTLKLLTELQEILAASGIVSKYEREMIVKAMNLNSGHWYKCPNGHFYCIGECGGAMQVGTCPECGAAIGGTRHTLLQDNAHAPEMDGSRHPAWSERNNLLNFGNL